MRKVLNFGSLNIDHKYNVEHFTAPGETQSCLEYSIGCGGKGLNQSIALSLAGILVFHAGIIGGDGLFLRDKLNEKGVNTDFIKVVDGHCGHAIIEVSSSGQNRILLYPGTNHLVDKDFVDSVLKHFRTDDIVVLQNEITGMEYIINKCREKGLKIVFNGAPVNEKILSYPIEKTDWLIVNEVEGAALSGESDNDKIPHALRKKYPDVNILLTLGKDGSRIVTEKEDLSCPSFNVPVVDTTAAGDTFIGYFVRGIMDNMGLKETMKLATAASSLTVMKEGAADSIPNYDEVKKFITEQQL